MDKLADLDTSFLVPCVHCDALFQEGERFCPSCGKDQRFTDGTRSKLGTVDDQGVGWLGARNPGQLQPDTDRAPMFPEERPRTRSSTMTVVLWMTAFVVLAVTLTLGARHYSERRVEADRLQAAEAAVTQLRTALDRGDLPSAERALGMLDADQANERDVVALKRIFEQRMQEQAARREQLSAAALNASRSLGFAQGTATPAAAAAAAVVEPTPKPAPVSAPQPSPAPTAACNEALAAMSLCQPN